MKNFYKTRKKISISYQKKGGITLITLVVTIIVLLILAGVTLSFVAGENGVLKRATNAVDKHNKAAIAEEIELAMADLQMQYYEEYYVDKSISQTQVEYITQKLEEGVETNNGTVKLEEEKVIYKSFNGTIAEGTFDAETGSILIEGVTIKGESPEKNIEIQLDKSNITLTTFNTNTYTLIPTITPSTTAYKIEWTSSDAEIASVNQDGTVTAKANGTAVITAQIQGREDVKAMCNVVVTDKICEFEDGYVYTNETWGTSREVLDLAFSSLTDGSYSQRGRYGALMLAFGEPENRLVFDLYVNTNIEFSSGSYPNYDGRGVGACVFYKESDGGYNEKYYTLEHMRNTQKYGKYYFPAGKYKLEATKNYVEFDQWDFEIVN